jgi:hypothetical protein
MRGCLEGAVCRQACGSPRQPSMVLEDQRGRAVSQAVECIFRLFQKYERPLRICRSAPPRLDSMNQLCCLHAVILTIQIQSDVTYYTQGLATPVILKACGQMSYGF